MTCERISIKNTEEQAEQLTDLEMATNVSVTELHRN
jgi:hypothetical protein